MPARSGAGLARDVVSPTTAAVIALFVLGSACGEKETPRGQAERVVVTLPASAADAPVDGRLLLMFSTDSAQEPRFQINDGPGTQQIFGVDATGLPAGGSAIFGDTVFGFPKRSLGDIPAGDYWVQALLHRYEAFHRADGHTLLLPMDRGEGQHWNLAPGNLYSRPVKLHYDPGHAAPLHLTLDQVIPALPPRVDTKYIRHVRMQSAALTKFWGRPMFVEATLLLPAGFDEHPAARYPVLVYHGHHEREFAIPVQFREQPPDSSVKGAARLLADGSYAFYQFWTAPDRARAIIVTIQHANPYYDDSYAVNSANVGPYGDAINRELLPLIEKSYRGIGAGWARVLFGGSTGGWETLATQIFYPDDYNGAWTFCPDPVDFRHYRQVNIYADTNAYYVDGPWKRTLRPGYRNYLGEIRNTFEDRNYLELVLGTKGRSGQQHDIWQAVYGPVGADGYPAPIWDKRTGVIDHQVAAYWKEHYDLRAILERDWPTLGPKLRGKIRVYIGDMDNGYLNNAVYRLDAFFRAARNPASDAVVEYGDRYEHCWSGDHTQQIQVQRLTIMQRFFPAMVQHMIRTAPPGADTLSWRY